MHRNHPVSDATYKAAVDKFGEQCVMGLIAVNGYYVLVSMTRNVDRTPAPGGRPPLPILNEGPRTRRGLLVRLDARLPDHLGGTRDLRAQQIRQQDRKSVV